MKTEELSGAELDHWVARAMGYELDADGDNRTIRDSGGAPSKWSPSADWADGGPIIERENIELQRHASGEGWWAGIAMPPELNKRGGVAVRGPTALVAAMRAFVASKFGKEVAGA